MTSVRTTRPVRTKFLLFHILFTGPLGTTVKTLELTSPPLIVVNISFFLQIMTTLSKNRLLD